MKRLVPVFVAGLVLAACAQSTTTEPDAVDTGTATTASAPPVADATTGEASDETPTGTDAAGDDPAVAEGDGEQTDSETADTQAPVATDPPFDAEEPTPTTAPPVGVPVPFDGVATFYAGSGFEGQAWAPIGWWDGTTWAEQTFDESGIPGPVPSPSLSSVAASSLDLGDEGVVDGLELGSETEYCVGNGVGPIIDLGVEVPDTPASLGYDVLAVTADWPLQPRPVRQVGLEVPEYSTVGAELFAPVPDAATTGEVVQVVRVDLDGDTIEEVLVTFENITSDFGAAGDFSGVYARYPSADGTVVDELVVGYIPDEPDGFPTIGRHTLAAVADLNGDGVMEVVVRDTFWEYGGMTVYALEAGRLTAVASGGCGI